MKVIQGQIMKANASEQEEHDVGDKKKEGDSVTGSVGYDNLVDFVEEMQSDQIARHIVEEHIKAFVYLESRLLDNRNYDQWLSLFSAECLYWVPNRYELGDPRTQTGIYLDDQRRMTDRVSLIQTGFLHAQTPPSRTLRTITNIEQWGAPNGNIRVCMNALIWEYRKGQMHCFPARQAYEIRNDEKNLGRGSIQLKVVHLLDCDSPQGNYSFMY